MAGSKPIVDILGIRHHGPGSAHSLLRHLHEQPPDLILIEGPPDADQMIHWAAHAGMTPPVALLVFNPKQLRQAAFYPFAEYSPEWQALLFGLKNGIPVRFMDLPQHHMFAMAEDPETAPAQIREDPFSDLAAMAGYTDPERWWEAMVEYGAAAPETDSLAPFVTILELFEALRSSKATPESQETLLREAWMRKTIRAALKEPLQRIAVVCGAWHAPALAQVDAIPATADTALLKGLKKVKTEATWIPWSFDRLAFAGGYRAGVLAPAWYQILWEHFRKGAVSPHGAWLTQAARLLRAEGLDTSSAHIIEAARLADTLATLRGMILPGIEELRECAVAVLGNGTNRFLDLIDRKLVTGDQIGGVPDVLPTAPLKCDFEQLTRSLRLQRNTHTDTVQLDLRKEPHLLKSRFLHRLHLLGIPWGTPEAQDTGKHGTFHETWTLQWQMEFEIRLIEAGAWGNTVEEAAGHILQRRTGEAETLPELVVLLDILLKTDLLPQLPALTQRLQSASALAMDTLQLADALLPLVEAYRYGNVRNFDLQILETIIAQTIPRVCIQLPDACIGINEDASAELLKKMVGINRAIGLLQKTEFEAYWLQALNTICELADAAPLLSGFAFRLRFDKQAIQLQETAIALQFHLSAAQAPMYGALWLEGFLHGSGLLLIHHPELWQVLNHWVTSMNEAHFTETLPLLRRGFSRFTAPERSRILDMSKTGRSLKTPAPASGLSPRTKPVEELLRLILPPSYSTTNSTE